MANASAEPGNVETKGDSPKNQQDQLMQQEERNTGAVTWDIYRKYLKASGGVFWGPLIILIFTPAPLMRSRALF